MSSRSAGMAKPAPALSSGCLSGGCWQLWGFLEEMCWLRNGSGSLQVWIRGGSIAEKQPPTPTPHLGSGKNRSANVRISFEPSHQSKQRPVQNKAGMHIKERTLKAGTSPLVSERDSDFIMTPILPPTCPRLPSPGNKTQGNLE